jgi:hypothetical protein
MLRGLRTADFGFLGNDKRALACLFNKIFLRADDLVCASGFWVSKHKHAVHPQCYRATVAIITPGFNTSG